MSTRPISQLANDLAAAREAVEKILMDLAIEITITAKAIAERLIVEKGIGYTYSTVLYPAFYLVGKELNGRGTQFLHDKMFPPSLDVQERRKAKDKTKAKLAGKPAPTIDPYAAYTNWGEFREAQGLQNKFVDWHYSNKMFQAMAPIDPKRDGDIFRAPLGATNREAQDKMNWNYERYGDFIGKALTQDDLKFLSEFATDKVLTTLKSIGLIA